MDLYAEPLDPKRPVVCFDESPFQLLDHVRGPQACAPGKARREDFEYRRAGVANAMMTCQPAAGLRTCLAMESKTKIDFANCRRRIEELFPEADKIRLAMDNLSTHSASALLRALGEGEMWRMMDKFEFHFTPKHASWLNVAELEFAGLGRSVFKKRISSAERFKVELDARCASRNAEGKPVKWLFTKEKAREKMGKRYPGASSNST